MHRRVVGGQLLIAQDHVGRPFRDLEGAVYTEAAGFVAGAHVEVLGGLCALASEAEEDGLDVVFFTSL